MQSQIVIAIAQLRNVEQPAHHVVVSGAVNDWMTGHAEILYDPQQSFGQGTITDLNRNQLQLRKAYALFGDLKVGGGR